MKRATLGFIGERRWSGKKGNDSRFAVSSNQNERSGKMVGQMVLDEETPFAAVELLRVFSKDRRASGSGGAGGDSSFGRCAIHAVCEWEVGAPGAGAGFSAESELRHDRYRAAAG